MKMKRSKSNGGGDGNAIISHPYVFSGESFSSSSSPRGLRDSEMLTLDVMDRLEYVQYPYAQDSFVAAESGSGKAARGRTLPFSKSSLNPFNKPPIQSPLAAASTPSGDEQASPQLLPNRSSQKSDETDTTLIESPLSDRRPARSTRRRIKGTIRLLFSPLPRRHYPILLVAVGLAIGNGIIPALMTLILGSAFDAYTAYNPTGLPSSEVPSSERTTLHAAVGKNVWQLCVLALATFTLSTGMISCWIIVGERIAAQIRERVYIAVSQKKMEWFDLGMGSDEGDKEGEGKKQRDQASEDSGTLGSGGLMTRFARETDDVRIASGQTSGQMVQYLTTAIASLVLAIVKSWNLTLVILAAIPLVIVLTAVVEVFGRPLLLQEQTDTSMASSLLERVITSISTVKAFNGETREQERFRALVQNGTRTYKKISLLWALRLGIGDTLMFAMFVSGFWYGSDLYQRGHLSAGNVMTVFWCCVLASTQLQMVVQSLNVVERGKVAIAKLTLLAEDDDGSNESRGRVSSVKKLEDLPTVSYDGRSSPGPSPASTKFSHRSSSSISKLPILGNKSMRRILPNAECRGAITLQNVTFCYPSVRAAAAAADGCDSTLKGINMTFRAGETVFIVGGSGSGKSTIAQLLLRMYRPDQGTILLDEQDMRFLDPGWCRQNIASVDQNPIVFDLSVHENVALGLCGTTLGDDKDNTPSDPNTHVPAVDRRRVREACRLALLDEFVRGLPQGYDTILGSKGASLSGGQKQRLAIARARLRDPAVLILDEATSALDVTSRLLVNEAVKVWRKKRTTIIITHDLSQVESGDFLYMMQGGAVVESGYRRDLQTKPGGRFEELARRQMSEVESQEKHQGKQFDDPQHSQIVSEVVSPQYQPSSLAPPQLARVRESLRSTSSTWDYSPTEPFTFSLAEADVEELEEDERAAPAVPPSAPFRNGSKTGDEAVPAHALERPPSSQQSPRLPSRFKYNPSSSVSSFDGAAVANGEQPQSASLDRSWSHSSVLSTRSERSLFSPSAKSLSGFTQGQGKGQEDEVDLSGAKGLRTLRLARAEHDNVAVQAPWLQEAGQKAAEARSRIVSATGIGMSANPSQSSTPYLERETLLHPQDAHDSIRGTRRSMQRRAWTEAELKAAISPAGAILGPSALVQASQTTNKDGSGDHVSLAVDGSQIRRVPMLHTLRRAVGSNQHKWLLVVGLVSCVAGGGITPVFSYFLAELLATMTDAITSVERSRLVLRYALSLLGLSFLQGLLAFARMSVMEIVAQKWIQDLRLRALSKVLKQDKAWFDRSSSESGLVVNRIIKDSEDARSLLSRFFGNLVNVVAMVLAGLTWAMIEGWQLTLVGMSVAPIFILAIAAQSRLVTRFEGRNKLQREKVARCFYDVVSNIRGVRSMALEPVFAAQFHDAAVITERDAIRVAPLSGFGFGLGEGLTYLSEALMFYVGAVFIVQGSYDFKKMIIVFNLFIFAVTFAAGTMAYLPGLSKGVQATADLLDLIEEDERGESSSEAKGYLAPPLATAGNISFRDVHFVYPSRPTVPVLRGATFDIQPGESLAIVGGSGSGKSTVAALLQRLYEPCSGQVAVEDGLGLDQVQVRHLRESTAVVSQSPNLFDMTVAENICYGLPVLSPLPWDAQEAERQSRRRLVELSATLAECSDFINTLPKKLDTSLGESATLISGGQRQRLAIARGVMKLLYEAGKEGQRQGAGEAGAHATSRGASGKLLILDEATSALDDVNRAKVLENLLSRSTRTDASSTPTLHSLLGESTLLTTLVVTHKLDEMKVCDRIVVLDQGKVVQVGPYAELIAQRGGAFRELANAGEWGV